jgi:squalene cyclase
VEMPVASDSLPELAEQLVKRQNRDGGWGYTSNTSWTEPTSLSLLALSTTGAFPRQCTRGCDWLRRLQREDGGWPPQRGVDQSTWVTASVLLVPGIGNLVRHHQAVDWILNRTGRESSISYRLLSILFGTRQEAGARTRGWPWFPDAAAWVTPTAFSILALQKSDKEQHRAAVRIDEGREFLLARICSDGGWNHGSAKALGQGATSYPDTTGQALVALHGIADARLKAATAYAERQLRVTRSAEEASWLQLGLAAHGCQPVDPGAGVVCRTTNALALRMLAIASRDKHAFL